MVLSVFLNWKGKNNSFPISLKVIEGGLTNINYSAEINGNKYFMRYVNNSKQLLDTSWDKEYEAITLVSSYGIAPKIISIEPSNQIIITEFIDGLPVNIKEVSSLNKICDLLHILHDSDIKFSTVQQPMDIIHLYIQNIKSIDAILPSIILDYMLPIMEHYNLPFHIAPCHLDLHQGNFLDDGEKLWLLDWEYAAMSNPLFDLTTLASVDQFSEKEMQKLLEIYLKKAPSPDQLKDFYFLRAVADLRWALWSYIQESISPIEAPYKEQGDGYLKNGLYYLSLIS